MYWQYAIMEHHWHNAGNNYRVPKDILVSYGFWKLSSFMLHDFILSPVPKLVLSRSKILILYIQKVSCQVNKNVHT